LRKYDDQWPISQYLTHLQQNGYNYQPKLYDKVISWNSVLWAACHSDNALCLAGIMGIKPMTADNARSAWPAILLSTWEILDDENAMQTGCHEHPTLLA
jgi:hypothetical protein